MKYLLSVLEVFYCTKNK